MKKINSSYYKNILFLLLFPNMIFATNIFDKLQTIKATKSYTSAPKKSNIIELKLPISIFTSLVKSKFNGLKIHLNNYGSRHGTSWYKGGSSYVTLPPALGGSHHAFSLSPINKFPFRYYINDVNLQSINVTTSKNRFLLQLKFEDRGTEIKGRCAGKGAKRYLCVKGSDRSAPDVQMNQALASVYLTPSVRNNSLSFSTVSTNFNAKIRVGKTCRKLGSLCTSVFDYKSYIKKEVNKALKKVIDKNSIRDKIASTLRNELAKKGIQKIVGVRIQGNKLIVRFTTSLVSKH